MTPNREQILAASAGWVAVLLNVIPGLGAGYLYQRRWRAYWITSALATIPGVGPATLDVLLTTFKSAAGVKRAPAEALEQAVGPAKAKKVIAWVTSQEKA